MHHPAQLSELVQQRHAELHRDAAESRLAAAARADPAALGPRRPVRARTRHRLGLLLVAWGSRLAPVDPPASR